MFENTYLCAPVCVSVLRLHGIYMYVCMYMYVHVFFHVGLQLSTQ